MSFLSRIQSKSADQKARYAFVGAFVVTLAIAGIWTTTIPARFNEISSSMESADSQTGNVGEGIDSFMNGIDTVISDAEIDQLDQNESEEESVVVEGALGELATKGFYEVPSATSTKQDTGTTTPGVPVVQDNGDLRPSVPTTTTPQPRVIQIATTTKKAE